MGLFSFMFLINIVLVLSKPIDLNNIKIEEVIGLNTETKIVEVNNSSAEFRNEAAFLNQIRPGMQVTDTRVEIEVNGNTFVGKAAIDVALTDTGTIGDDILFYFADLRIRTVTYQILGVGAFLTPDRVSVDEDDGTLEIEPGRDARSYTFTIEYEGTFGVAGRGLYLGQYGDAK